MRRTIILEPVADFLVIARHRSERDARLTIHPGNFRCHTGKSPTLGRGPQRKIANTEGQHDGRGDGQPDWLGRRHFDDAKPLEAAMRVYVNREMNIGLSRS